VDYLTFVLAKSCKLLPVMGLHVLLYRKRYPWTKYAIVAAVTAGVAVFTLYHPPKAGKSGAKRENSVYGLGLLGVNLVFDGLTNTTQDRVFGNEGRFGRVKGGGMMVWTNVLSCALMLGYLTLLPLVPGEVVGVFAEGKGRANLNELQLALEFVGNHPGIKNDILMFAAAGAIGQLFIFATLERFSSLVLVTVTVTRKMLTMLLSVVWFGKSLGGMQWVGVGLVFAGVGLEAGLKYLPGESKKGKKS
jgi:solute carrier family 35 (UDP-galactose transporter), member B1